jgi:asparagine synthase (glutamine-hydrolysing)
MLALYEEMGEAMLGELRGMFALALWDGRRRRMFLARDPYGIKPLYYADDGRTIRIASQVKALIAGGRVDKRFDPAAAAGFFLRGTVPEPFTMYRAIRALPAGSYAYVDEHGISEPRQYFSIAATLRDGVEAKSRTRNDSSACTTRCSSPSAITWSRTFRSARSSRRASTRAPSSRSRASRARRISRR